MTTTIASNDYSGSPQLTPPQRPARIVTVEMSEPVKLPAPATDAVYRSLWIVVRVFGETVGLVQLDDCDADPDLAVVVHAIGRECGAVLRSRVRDAGGDIDRVIGGLGCEGVLRPTAFHTRHEAVAATGPSITVVVCTRNRTADLVRAIDSLRRQTYPMFRVLVVDNSPDDELTRRAVESFSSLDRRFEYTRQLIPGLSWARNHGLSMVMTPVVAWLDDDEEADEYWLAEIADCFARDESVVAVSGAVLPAELETISQIWFEEFGGHSKGRGFEPARFGPPDGDQQSPLYPLPPFGAGANMAFRTAALREIGGFHTALGAGTSTKAGEDTLAFTQLLLVGGHVVYRPSAVTRHYHRREFGALSAQMRGYGVGLTAFYAALLHWRPRLIFPLLRLTPGGLRDAFGRRGQAAGGLSATFPRELLRLKTRGMAVGPWEYLRATRRARSRSRAAS